MTSADHASAMQDLIAFLAGYWWLFILFGGAIGSFFEGVRDFFLGCLNFVLEAGERRHRRRMELLQAQHGGRLPIAVREDGEVITAPARACAHPFESLENVYSGRELVAHLCTRCDTQLPISPADAEEGQR